MFPVDSLKDEKIHLVTMKVLDEEYVNSDNICMGSAHKYSLIPQKGQGDPEEGVFARIKKDNEIKLKEIRLKYSKSKWGKLIEEVNGEFVDFKLSKVIHIPMYCCYSIHASNSMVESKKELIGSYPKCNAYEVIFQLRISKEVFSDFVENRTIGVIHWGSPDYIKKAIEKQYNCIVENRNIKYVNRQNREWECPEEHPAELFYKEKSLFQHQNEKRFVIKSNTNYINKFKKDGNLIVHVDSRLAMKKGFKLDDSSIETICVKVLAIETDSDLKYRLFKM